MNCFVFIWYVSPQKETCLQTITEYWLGDLNDSLDFQNVFRKGGHPNF